MVVTWTVPRLTVAAAVLLAWPVVAQAQPMTRIRRIGLVSSISPGPAIALSRQGLRDAGYIEGKNGIVGAAPGEAPSGEAGHD